MTPIACYSIVLLLSFTASLAEDEVAVMDVIVSAHIDDSFEEEPAELRLDAVYVLAHRLHEGLSSICVTTVLCISIVLALLANSAALIRRVQQMQLPVYLL